MTVSLKLHRLCLAGQFPHRCISGAQQLRGFASGDQDDDSGASRRLRERFALGAVSGASSSDSYRTDPSNSYRANSGQRFQQRQMPDRGSGRQFGGGQGGFNRFEDFGIGQNMPLPNWDKEQMTPLEKNFYSEHSDVSSRDMSDVTEFMVRSKVTIKGEHIPKPVFSFEETGFPEDTISHLKKQFTIPTVIQSASWPIVLSGRDLIGIAQTGSGKTLSFVLPAIVHVKNQKPLERGDGPIALFLAPTRELAVQVQSVAKQFVQMNGLRQVSVYGGAAKGPQINALMNGVHIVIATPGRLVDLMESGMTNLKRCSFLVMDEADRMLDMGFEPQIRSIVEQIRPGRQTVMWSATWPDEVRNLASEFNENSVFVNVGSLDLAANHNIHQHVEVVDDRQKSQKLIKLLTVVMRTDDPKTLIFTATKRTAEEMTRWLRSNGWPALCIHGDKSQSERDWAMREYRENRCPILIATDVASRGLDVSDIKVVVNYDFPNDTEDYIHRIGRTGRVDKQGYAYTFFTYDDVRNAKGLVKVLKEANQRINPALQEIYRSVSQASAKSVRRQKYSSQSSGNRSQSSGNRSQSSGRKKFGGGRGIGGDYEDYY